MDFTELDTSLAGEDGRWMNVRHPATGEIIPDARVLVASYDSEHAAEQRRKQQKRRLKRPAGEITPEEIERDTIDMVAAVTRQWEIQWQGAALDTSLASKRMLLGRLGWLRRQIDAFAQEAGNFLPNGGTISSPSPSISGNSVSAPAGAS